MHPADPQLVFACTNLGQVFRSEDGGESWIRLEREFGEIRALHWRPVASVEKQTTETAKPAVWTYN
jgi:hypothetical protein